MVDSVSSPPHQPAWASALGVVAIVLGVFLTAFHGTEWLRHTVLTGAMPENAQFSGADCPPAELEEEGLSLAECEYMVEHVRGLFLSMPPWFPTAQKWLAGIGTVLAFVSVVVGGALVNYKGTARTAAVAVFGALALIDVLQFAAVVNAGPIIRDLYLWGVVLWFLLHLMMTVGALVGPQHQPMRRQA